MEKNLSEKGDILGNDAIECGFKLFFKVFFS